MSRRAVMNMKGGGTGLCMMNKGSAFEDLKI